MYMYIYRLNTDNTLTILITIRKKNLRDGNVTQIYTKIYDQNIVKNTNDYI